MKKKITNDDLEQAGKEAQTMLEILRILRSVKDEKKRARILKAVAVLYGVPLE